MGQRTIIALTENWHIKQLDTDRPDVAALRHSAASPDTDSTWLSAEMLAQIHDILLKHGKIYDPHIGKNAAESAWVGEKDWAYTCTFASPTNGEGPIFLRFGGLDTLATVYLNGKKIGYFNNMYREYTVDVQEQLAPVDRDNVLLIVFSSPLRFINQVERPEHGRRRDVLHFRHWYPPQSHPGNHPAGNCRLCPVRRGRYHYGPLRRRPIL